MKLIKKAIAFATFTLPVMAMAAVPAGVETAITGASADGVDLVESLAVAGAAVFLLHKLLKRFGISL
ncbi:hypothetical protein [Methylibium petroleiphilum]|uniref:hypothetical protein n=1 Tax=Methylibium petroleiphilum TaxID=105560 RepID=UPI003D281D7C